MINRKSHGDSGWDTDEEYDDFKEDYEDLILNLLGLD